MSFQYTAFQKAGVLPNGERLPAVAHIYKHQFRFVVETTGFSYPVRCSWWHNDGDRNAVAGIPETIAAIEICGYTVKDHTGRVIWKPGARS